ncbi:hypothetical protein ECZU01_18370 [Escherichia coli]|nr:hypothetical protein ECZU01_18370 [Escherichia coli]
MRVDIGARSYDEVMQAGIRPGDRVTFDTTFQVLPHQRVMGKAFDDRLGCYLLVTLLRELHDAELPAEVWLVASSSEEVGLRGGQTATRAVSPDVAIVLDTACWAKNFDYGAANHRQIGNGPMLVLSDKSLIAPPKLTAWVETVAAELACRCRQICSATAARTAGGALNRHRRAHSGDGASNPPWTLRRIDCRLPRHFADAATFICPYSTSYA